MRIGIGFQKNGKRCVAIVRGDKVNLESGTQWFLKNCLGVHKYSAGEKTMINEDGDEILLGSVAMIDELFTAEPAQLKIMLERLNKK